jgi:hypothetical protein
MDLFSGEWSTFSDPGVYIDFVETDSGNIFFKKDSPEVQLEISNEPKKVWAFVEGKYLSYIENDVHPELQPGEKLTGYLLSDGGVSLPVGSALIWSVKLNCTYCNGSGRIRDREEDPKTKCVYCEGRKTRLKEFPDFNDVSKFEEEHFKRTHGKKLFPEEEEPSDEYLVYEQDAEEFYLAEFEDLENIFPEFDEGEE